MVSETVSKRNPREEKMLADQLCKTLHADNIKQIARQAYLNNLSDTMPIVKKLSKNTGDRQIKAAWILWKYKIFVPNGEIILNRIAAYCGANVSNWYIDLCIYKDVFTAVRQKNSGLFRQRNSN